MDTKWRAVIDGANVRDERNVWHPFGLNAITSLLDEAGITDSKIYMDLRQARMYEGSLDFLVDELRLEIIRVPCADDALWGEACQDSRCLIVTNDRLRQFLGPDSDTPPKLQESVRKRVVRFYWRDADLHLAWPEGFNRD